MRGLILLSLFIGLPIIEIALLLQVSDVIGGLSTIALVIATAVLGAYLVRQQGLRTLAEVQTQSAQGGLPARPLAEGLLILMAGAVLLTPGFVTDAFGFALLTPALRNSLINWAVKSALVQPGTATSGNSGFVYEVYSSKKPGSEQHIIQGEYRDND